MTPDAISVCLTTPTALSAISRRNAMTDPRKPDLEVVATEEADVALVGADLIEEVSIDGMCGVY
jgi:mycofactocin precursor